MGYIQLSRCDPRVYKGSRIQGCEVRQYLSSFGNVAVMLYVSKQSSYDFCQTFNSL